MQILNNQKKKNIFLHIFLIFIMLFIQIVLFFYNITNLSLSFVILNLVLFLSIIIFGIFYIKRFLSIQRKNEQIEVLESYNNSLTSLYDSVRGFKHDFNNIIYLITGFIDANDIKGLKKYFNDLKNDCIKLNNEELINPKTINNPGIYNLIVSKQQKAKNLNITFSLEVFIDFNELQMPIYDFSRILGILLDNAIEAANNCKEKQINLLFRESKKNKTQIISIENTYNNKNIDTKAIFEKGFSEKNKHMGIGLWEVNKIINKNNNVKLKTTKNDKYFKQQLEIYY